MSEIQKKCLTLLVPPTPPLSPFIVSPFIVKAMTETAVYGTVRTVVWEDGGSNPASYPIGFLREKYGAGLVICGRGVRITVMARKGHEEYIEGNYEPKN